MKNNKASLSLTGLTLPTFDSDRMKKIEKELDEREKAYREKYGDNYMLQLLKDDGLIPDYDINKKSIDSAIYNRTWLRVSGHSEWARTHMDKQIERMRELFGKDCDIYTVLSETTIDIGDLLLKEALQTGKWKELPDELQPKYHELVKKK